jgi:hypothetical protein
VLPTSREHDVLPVRVLTGVLLVLSLGLHVVNLDLHIAMVSDNLVLGEIILPSRGP